MLKASLSVSQTAAVPRRDAWPLSEEPSARLWLMQHFTGTIKLATPVLQLVGDSQQSCGEI